MKKNKYKKYLIRFLIFIPVILFLIAVHLNTPVRKSNFPNWYYWSKVIHKVADKKYKNCALFLGNSFIASAINPERIKQNDGEYFVFAQGSTSAVEILLWLYKNNIYPKKIFLELNTYDLKASYNADFPVIAPDSDNKFDVFKSRIEMKLRLFSENHLRFIQYDKSPKDYLSNLARNRSITGFLKYAFAPDENLFSKSAKDSKNEHNSSKQKSKKITKSQESNPKSSNIEYEKDKNHKTLKQPSKRKDGIGFLGETRVFDDKQTRERFKKFYNNFYSIRVKKNSDYILSSVKKLQFLINKFLDKKCEIVFIRIPKSKNIIELENEFTGAYFESCKKISENNEKVNYIDLTSEELLQKFRPSLNDGAHWTSKGANSFTEYLNEILKDNRYK